MEVKIPFGSVEKTKLLDDNGSTSTTTTKFFAGKISPPVRVRYTIKERVRSQKEEHERYILFSDEQKQDKSRLDPEFRIEHSTLGDQDGYYFVVTSWTVLEY